MIGHDIDKVMIGRIGFGPDRQQDGLQLSWRLFQVVTSNCDSGKTLVKSEVKKAMMMSGDSKKSFSLSRETLLRCQSFSVFFTFHLESFRWRPCFWS